MSVVAICFALACLQTSHFYSHLVRVCNVRDSGKSLDMAMCCTNIRECQLRFSPRDCHPNTWVANKMPGQQRVEVVFICFSESNRKLEKNLGKQCSCSLQEEHTVTKTRSDSAFAETFGKVREN